LWEVVVKGEIVEGLVAFACEYLACDGPILVHVLWQNRFKKCQKQFFWG